MAKRSSLKLKWRGSTYPPSSSQWSPPPVRLSVASPAAPPGPLGQTVSPSPTPSPSRVPSCSCRVCTPGAWILISINCAPTNSAFSNHSVRFRSDFSLDKATCHSCCLAGTNACVKKSCLPSGETTMLHQKPLLNRLGCMATLQRTVVQAVNQWNWHFWLRGRGAFRLMSSTWCSFLRTREPRSQVLRLTTHQFQHFRKLPTVCYSRKLGSSPQKLGGRYRVVWRPSTYWVWYPWPTRWWVWVTRASSSKGNPKGKIRSYLCFPSEGVWSQIKYSVYVWSYSMWYYILYVDPSLEHFKPKSTWQGHLWLISYFFKVKLIFGKHSACGMVLKND